MSCEIHRTHQRNNNNYNNNRITTTMVQQPHNGHRLSFCWKWATATSFAIGGTFLYSHILQHTAEGRDARIDVREREGGEGGRVCLHFFKKHPLRINGCCAPGVAIEQGVLCLVLFMQNYVSIKRNTRCNCQKLHSRNDGHFVLLLLPRSCRTTPPPAPASCERTRGAQLRCVVIRPRICRSRGSINRTLSEFKVGSTRCVCGFVCPVKIL